jgi:FixJ family two-component response regulator
MYWPTLERLHETRCQSVGLARMTKRIVSIVDDDKSVRDGLSSLLRSFGTETHSFASSGEFLDSAYADKSDCLFTDVQMQGMSGLDLQDELVRRGSKVPIIFITAFPSDAARKRAKVGGALFFLEKPFDAKTIEECLKVAFGRRT